MYKYTLEKKSLKHICPKCGKKRFVRYVDQEKEEYLSKEVGRCDREVKCAYHYTPKTFFKNKGQLYEPIIINKDLRPKSKKGSSFHSDRVLQDSLMDYDKNNFIIYLKTQFENKEVQKMLQDYQVGTASYWYNSTVFWQIDEHKNIRGAKIIKYNHSGKRTRYINWLHAIQLKEGKISSFQLNQCLFGLHLIKKYQKTIAIVESEKTACVMSLLFDKYLWLATGSLNGLTQEKIRCLKDRKIILYPDLGKIGETANPFEQWKHKCNDFKKIGFDVEISDLLEQKATSFHREKGYDLADYFLENRNTKPRKIISTHQQKYIDFYLKNQNLKTLIEVFDLQDENGNRINL